MPSSAEARPIDHAQIDHAKSRIWPATIVGAVIAVIGLVLAGGGAWLAWLGGSIYYLLTGVAMIASGILLMRGRMAGAWLYAAIVAGTIAWAWWEVGPDGWAQVARIVAPIVLLLAVLLVMPGLTRRDHRWKLAFGGIAAVLVLTAANFAVADWLRGDARYSALPAPVASLAGQGVAEDWPAYGGTQAAQRFSRLAQITPANVGRLKRAWVAHTGDLPDNSDDENKYGAETTPIKVGRNLYMCSATNVLLAYDAATGKELWRTDPVVPHEWIPYTAACRGVAYYEVPDAAPDASCAARVVEGTLDGRLIEVDARDGHYCAGFGDNGQVDYKRGMGHVDPGMVATTAPPVIANGVIVVNHQVHDNIDLDAPSGVIQGFDARTGEAVWAWDMMHPGWARHAARGRDLVSRIAQQLDDDDGRRGARSCLCADGQRIRRLS